VILLMACQMAEGINSVDLVPKPKSLQNGKGIFTLKRVFRVENSEFKYNYARFLNTVYFEGLDYNCINSSDKMSEIKIRKLSIKMHDEAYHLAIGPNGVEIEASTHAGVLYGIQTLKQILVQSWNGNEFLLPFLKIEDEPCFPMRGFMLDASRHFQPLATVKHVLDYMLSMKLNVFHWHLSDDQGWRIQSLKYPELNLISSFVNVDNAPETNGFYSIDEIHEVITYATDRNIEIIPEFDIPGHSYAVLEAFPQLRCPHNPKSSAFCAGNPESLRVIKDIFGEMIDIFKPRYIHIGGDERPRDLWNKCDLCKAKMKEVGVNNENDLQNNMLVEISEFIHSKGVKTISWAENLEGKLAEGQTIQSWRLDSEAYNSIKKGHEVYNSDNGVCYLDYPENIVDAISKPKWMLVLSIEKVYNFNPVPHGLSKEEARMVLGSECPLWTESITTDKIYPQIKGRLEAHSEKCWTPYEQKDFADFSKRMSTLNSYFKHQFYQQQIY
jgi:hexosaminidase